MTKSTLPLVAIGWIACCGALASADPAAKGNSLLVEASGLQKMLSSKNLRILDVRSQTDYAKGHIPGAVRVDVGEWKTLALADDGLYDTKGWAKLVGAHGVSDGNHVVVYGSKITDAARIWWLLKYVGLKNVSLVNGGWQAWTKNDRTIETSVPDVQPVKFKPRLQANRLAEMSAVKKSLKSDEFQIVDTRSDSEFAGGRVPGAVHLEWKHLLADDGRFKTSQQLKTLFRKQGVLPNESAVCY